MNKNESISCVEYTFLGMCHYVQRREKHIQVISILEVTAALSYKEEQRRCQDAGYSNKLYEQT